MEDSFEAILEQALKLTQATNLPTNLQGIAFEKAIDYLLRNTKSQEAERPGIVPLSNVEKLVDSSQSPIEVLAQKLRIDSSVVQEIFSFEKDTGLQLIVGASKLGSERRAAMRLLAILVAGGRQVAGLEEWTKLSTVREASEEYGKLDATNFSTVVNGMDNFFGYRGKGGAQREMRLNRSGWQELKAVIERLSSDATGVN
jgi:hypothetical protein